MFGSREPARGPLSGRRLYSFDDNIACRICIDMACVVEQVRECMHSPCFSSEFFCLASLVLHALDSGQMLGV